MGTFLNAAHAVLERSGRPMTAREITQDALDQGYLSTSGKTPWQTMKSKLSTDILTLGERSLFMRSAEGTFALRAWSKVRAEFVADRFQRALFDEEILVFPASSLRKYAPGPGIHRSLDDRLLLAECFGMRRREAEEDLSVIQLVSVFIIRHNDRVLTYKRTRRLPESRLHGYYSLNFGGHLNPADVVPLFSILKPEEGWVWLRRELHEEVRLPPHAVRRFKYRGLLFDDSKPVSRQHVGVVYEAFVDTATFEIGERGFLMDPKYETVEAIRSRAMEFENWSLVLLNAIEKDWE